MLAHNVFFKLKDDSRGAREQLAAAARKYLSGDSHRGVVFFACGDRSPELKRDVNDLDFDVGLHVVFESKEAHDAYQTAPAHHQFIEENKANWDSVRVFDTDV